MWDKVGLIGNYKITHDYKGRIVIPAAFRKQLESPVVAAIEFDQVLVLRSVKEFEKWSKILLNESNFSSNIRYIKRAILGNSILLEFDKKGRLLLPKHFIKALSLSKELQIIGVGNHLEIMNAKRWNSLNKNRKHKKSAISLEKAAESLIPS